MGSNRRIGNLLHLRLRDFVLALLLGCVSWFILTPIWIHASPGGLTDKIIGGLFYIPYRAAKHLAHVLFRDSATRSTTRYYLAPIMGIAGEILAMTAVWVAGICALRSRRTTKNNAP